MPIYPRCSPWDQAAGSGAEIVGIDRSMEMTLEKEVTAL